MTTFCGSVVYVLCKYYSYILLFVFSCLVYNDSRILCLVFVILTMAHQVISEKKNPQILSENMIL